MTACMSCVWSDNEVMTWTNYMNACWVSVVCNTVTRIWYILESTCSATFQWCYHDDTIIGNYGSIVITITMNNYVTANLCYISYREWGALGIPHLLITQQSS